MSTLEFSGATGASTAAEAVGARHGSTAVVGATVHGFTVGYWWAAVLCSAPIRGDTRLHREAGHPSPSTRSPAD
jgi:hypothetical protein